jgi:hypothetical protein
MKADLDLSNLETGQADLWLFLQVDTILARIYADQGECWASNTTHRETLCGLLSESVPPRTLPTFSEVMMNLHLVSSGLN